MALSPRLFVAIAALDDHIGHVCDFEIDDVSWVAHYVVVQTGAWLSSRKVLISPIALLTPDWQVRTLPMAIKKAQLCDSSDIDTDRTVSRRQDDDARLHSCVTVDLDRKARKNAPPYVSGDALNQAWESNPHLQYKRAGYWEVHPSVEHGL